MVNWIVDTQILEGRHVIDDLLPAITSSGANLYTTKYIPFSDDIDFGPEAFQTQPTILYGTIGFVKRCKIPYIPGAYGFTDQMNCNHYYAHIPNEWLLNSDFVILPFNVIKNDVNRVFELFEKDQFFIRPISGYKTFTGFVVTSENYKHEFNASQQTTSVMPDTLCLVASAKHLKGEFRFVIGAGEVIDGSEYRWDNKLDIRHDYPSEAWEMANKMAKFSWQPDSVYTCDIAISENGAKIVEINAFACSGLYACDKKLVVNRINEIAEKEWRDG